MSEITETKWYSGLCILIAAACTIVAYLETTYPPGGVVGGLLVLAFAAGTIVSLREAIKSYRRSQTTHP